jgi:F-type H+-transporting ATPase subunit gamma
MPAEALQRKIKTTKDLREIVSNMKTLSSVSILQYEQANAVMDKYQRNLRDAVHVLALNNGIPNLSVQPAARPRYLFILIGTDNGMVGRFNRELIEQVKHFMKEQQIRSADTMFITIGKRLSQLVEQSGFNILAGFATSNSVKAVVALAEQAIIKMETAVRQKHISNVYTCFHERAKSVAVETQIKRILPVDVNGLQKLRHKKWETNNFPMLSTTPAQMFAALLSEMLMITLSKQINASLAAEHWTRMTNMQNAEKNIDENLDKMNLEYQQQRQEEITGELIDVISGANAIKKDES